MIVAPGSTSQSVTVEIRDDSGLSVTGLVAATFPAVTYKIAGASAAVSITLSDLSLITTAYSSGGVKEISGGYYRLDLPNAALSSAGTVTLIGDASGKHLIAPRIVVAYVPANVNQVAGQTASAAAGVTFPGTVSSYAGADTAGTTTLLTRITAAITTAAQDTTDNANLLSAIQAVPGLTWAYTGAARTLTSFGTLAADAAAAVWASVTRTLSGKPAVTLDPSDVSGDLPAIVRDITGTDTPLVYADTYATRGRAKTQAYFRAALTQRVRMIGIGNSNQVKDGHGWDHGLSKALYALYGSWGTGVLPVGGDNGGASPSIGYLCSGNGGATGQNAQFTGAPSALNAYGPSGALGWYHHYTYLPPGTTYTASSYVNKVLVDPAHPLDVTGPLRYLTSFGLFPSSFGVGTGINLAFANRLTSNPTSGAISTTSSTYGIGDFTLDVAPGAMYSAGLNLEAAHNPQGSPDIVGPFFQQYGQVVNTSKTSGLTYTTMLFAGSQSNRTMLASLISLGATARREFLRQHYLENGEDQWLAITLNDGLNARNETQASIPNGITPGDSAAAEADNWQGIVDLLTADWLAVSGSDNIAFLEFSPAPVSDPNDAELTNYANAGRSLADANDGYTYTDLARLVNETIAAIFRQSGGADTSHYTQPGYEWYGYLLAGEWYPAGSATITQTSPAEIAAELERENGPLQEILSDVDDPDGIAEYVRAALAPDFESVMNALPSTDNPAPNIDVQGNRVKGGTQ